MDVTSVTDPTRVASPLPNRPAAEPATAGQADASAPARPVTVNPRQPGTTTPPVPGPPMLTPEAAARRRVDLAAAAALTREAALLAELAEAVTTLLTDPTGEPAGPSGRTQAGQAGAAQQVDTLLAASLLARLRPLPTLPATVTGTADSAAAPVDADTPTGPKTRLLVVLTDRVAAIPLPAAPTQTPARPAGQGPGQVDTAAAAAGTLNAAIVDAGLDDVLIARSVPGAGRPAVLVSARDGSPVTAWLADAPPSAGGPLPSTGTAGPASVAAGGPVDGDPWQLLHTTATADPEPDLADAVRQAVASGDPDVIDDAVNRVTDLRNQLSAAARALAETLPRRADDATSAAPRRGGEPAIAGIEDPAIDAVAAAAALINQPQQATLVQATITDRQALALLLLLGLVPTAAPAAARQQRHDDTDDEPDPRRDPPWPQPNEDEDEDPHDDNDETDPNPSTGRT